MVRTYLSDRSESCSDFNDSSGRNDSKGQEQYKVDVPHPRGGAVFVRRARVTYLFECERVTSILGSWPERRRGGLPKKADRWHPAVCRLGIMVEGAIGCPVGDLRLDCEENTSGGEIGSGPFF